MRKIASTILLSMQLLYPSFTDINHNSQYDQKDAFIEQIIGEKQKKTKKEEMERIMDPSLLFEVKSAFLKTKEIKSLPKDTTHYLENKFYSKENKKIYDIGKKSFEMNLDTAFATSDLFKTHDIYKNTSQIKTPYIGFNQNDLENKTLIILKPKNRSSNETKYFLLNDFYKKSSN